MSAAPSLLLALSGGGGGHPKIHGPLPCYPPISRGFSHGAALAASSPPKGMGSEGMGMARESDNGSPQLSWSDAPHMSPSPSHLATPQREAVNSSATSCGDQQQSSASRSGGVACEGYNNSAQPSAWPELAIVSEEQPLWSLVPAPPPAEMASTAAVDQVRKLHVLVTRLHALVTKLQVDNRRLRVDRAKARQKTAVARAETARLRTTAIAAATSLDEEARPRALIERP